MQNLVLGCLVDLCENTKVREFIFCIVGHIAQPLREAGDNPEVAGLSPALTTKVELFLGRP